MSLDQPAAIIKNENGMFTIRNPALHQAVTNGLAMGGYRQFGGNVNYYTPQEAVAEAARAAQQKLQQQQQAGSAAPVAHGGGDSSNFSYFSSGSVAPSVVTKAKPAPAAVAAPAKKVKQQEAPAHQKQPAAKTQAQPKSKSTFASVGKSNPPQQQQQQYQQEKVPPTKSQQQRPAESSRKQKQAPGNLESNRSAPNQRCEHLQTQQAPRSGRVNGRTKPTPGGQQQPVQQHSNAHAAESIAPPKKSQRGKRGHRQKQGKFKFNHSLVNLERYYYLFYDSLQRISLAFHTTWAISIPTKLPYRRSREAMPALWLSSCSICASASQEVVPTRRRHPSRPTAALWTS